MIAFKDTILAYALYYPAVEILSSIAIALVIWLGGYGVLRNTVQLGVLVAFIQYCAALLPPHSGSERKVQHPAGGHGCQRAHLQAARHAAASGFACASQARATAARASSSATSGSPTSSSTTEMEGTHRQCNARKKWPLLAARSNGSCKDVSFTIDPGPDRGHRRPHRRGQDHHHQPDDALLRRAARQHDGQWRRRARAQPAELARVNSELSCRIRFSSAERSPTTSAWALIGSPMSA